MPIAIFLRTSKGNSLYRDAIIRSLNSGAGNYALLCSGFLQENKATPKGPSPYRATLEPGFSAALATHGIQLDTIGIHNSTWHASYVNFCNNLSAAGVTLVPYIMSGFQWHAKVFLLKQKSSPIFGIVGSSNLTANAFGVSNVPALVTDSPFPPTNFNFECDVYFWTDANIAIATIMEELIGREEIREQIILARYDEQENFGSSIEDRLNDIEEQIWNAGGLKALF
jgi:hypothetical protein